MANNSHLTRIWMIGHGYGVLQLRVTDRLAHEYWQVRSFASRGPSHQSANFQALGLCTELIAE